MLILEYFEMCILEACAVHFGQSAGTLISLHLCSRMQNSVQWYETYNSRLRAAHIGSRLTRQVIDTMHRECRDNEVTCNRDGKVTGALLSLSISSRTSSIFVPFIQASPVSLFGLWAGSRVAGTIAIVIWEALL